MYRNDTRKWKSNESTLGEYPYSLGTSCSRWRSIQIRPELETPSLSDREKPAPPFPCADTYRYRQHINTRDHPLSLCKNDKHTYLKTLHEMRRLKECNAGDSTPIDRLARMMERLFAARPLKQRAVQWESTYAVAVQHIRHSIRIIN